MLDRRVLLFALPALSVAAPVQAAAPSAADAADLARIEMYLNSIHTLKAHFVQVAPNGAISEGTAWLDRPGRMRFQYNPPSPLLLVAGHGQVVFHDASLDQTTTIPLSATPLGILLANHISLQGAVRVTDLERLPGEIVVTLVRSARPLDGSLRLVLSEPPLTLRQWTVVDAQGRATTVTLTNIERGGRFDQGLFQFTDPRFFRSHQGNG